MRQGFYVMKNFFFAFWGLILYRLSLDLAYPLISEYYAYAGMITTETAMSGVASWLIFLISLPFVLKFFRSDSLFSIFTILLYLCGFVPMTSLFMYINPSPGLVFSFLLYWGVFLFSALFLNGKKMPEMLSKKDYTIPLCLFLLILCTAVLYISWKYRGLAFHFNLNDVYSLRRDPNIENLGGFWRYMLTFANKLLPIAAIYFLWQRKWLVFSGLLLTCLLNFSISGHKSIFFSLLLGILLFFFYREWMLMLVPGILAFLNFTGIFVLETFGIFELISYITRRVLFIPALLNYHYYDHFSLVEPDFFCSGQIGKLLGVPEQYSHGISRFIGYKYFAKDQMAANNGLFSDAYANLGLSGCIIMPVILLISIRMLQYVSRNLPNKIMCSVAVVYTITFISSFFQTILISHALLITYVMLYFMSESNNSKESLLQK